MRSSRALRRGVLLLGACGLFVAASVSLQGHWSSPEDDASDVMTPSTIGHRPGTAAMRATLDPETGELVQGHQPVLKATPELEQMLSRSTDGLVPVHHPDGAVSVHLQGRFQNASMARIDSSGNLHTTCVDDAGAARAACRHLTTPDAQQTRDGRQEVR